MSALAGASVTLVLLSLVVGAFTITPTARASRTEVAAALTDEMRAFPLARGMVRVRDDTPVDTQESATVSAASAPEPVALATPEPAAEPTPEPAAEPTPEPAAEPTAAPTPRPTPAPIRTAAPAPIVSTTTATAEQRMLVLMNASRTAGGLSPLALDANVSTAARAHSEVESRYGYVYHDGPDGTAKSRYVPACGTGWYGENTGKVWRGNVDALNIEFMNEPWDPINHRTNIMDPNFRRVGIGAVQGSDALYMTMAFCR